jgi:hypothetical protein
MLAAWGKGDEQALADVIPLVYDDLRRIARRHLGRSPGPGVQSGTLAHEAYLKLVHARSVVSDVLHGKRSISKAQARRLAEFFHVPASLFI